jgi:large subunit ribosomal protein L28
MAKVCELCGKGPTTGSTYARRGIAKAKGGIGIKVVRRNPRRFLPNLKRVKAIVKGSVTHIRACTSCIRAGHVVKAP